MSNFKISEFDPITGISKKDVLPLIQLNGESYLTRQVSVENILNLVEVPDDKHHYVTKAQYDSLSEAERLSDVIWCVTDDTSAYIPTAELEHKLITKDAYDSLPLSAKMKDIAYMISDDLDYGWDAIHRWQSSTDGSGQYSWFEIWPDGWCRLGGSKSVSTTGMLSIELPIFYKNTSFGAFKNYGSNKTTTAQDLEVSFFNKTLSAIVTNCNMTDTQLIDWMTEGYRDTELCTLNMIKEKYASIGIWSSNNIGINESTSGNGYGGGVIDGTLLGPETHIDSFSKTSTRKFLYEVKNDCFLVIIDKSRNAYGTTFTAGDTSHVIGSIACVRVSSTSTLDSGSVGIPIKKGSRIYALSISGSSETSDIYIYEYKLNSLAPQIAMPDYEKGISIATVANVEKEISANGFLISHSNDGPSDDVFIKTVVDGIEQWTPITLDGLADNASDTNMILVSKGDVIKSTNAKNNSIFFFPCKSVPQHDCPSYVIESGKFYSGTGLPAVEGLTNDSWYRLYSDGWCELGCCIPRSEMTFHLPFIDNSYTITESCGLNIYDKTTHGFTLTGSPGLNTGLEAKGWTK